MLTTAIVIIYLKAIDKLSISFKMGIMYVVQPMYVPKGMRVRREYFDRSVTLTEIVLRICNVGWQCDDGFRQKVI